VCSLLFPVSLRMGSNLFYEKNTVEPDRTAAMLVAQTTHRQVIVSAMKPPAIRTTAGPNCGRGYEYQLLLPVDRDASNYWLGLMP